MRGGCVRAQNLRRSGRVPISGSYIIRACSTESLKKEVRACFVFDTRSLHTLNNATDRSVT